MIIGAQVSFKFHGQLLLLVTQFTKEHFAYFFNVGLNFLLPFCHHLDFQYVHKAGRRTDQVIIKTARNAQELPKWILAYDIPFPSKDMHTCYMLPSTIRCRFQKKVIKSNTLFYLCGKHQTIYVAKVFKEYLSLPHNFLCLLHLNIKCSALYILSCFEIIILLLLLYPKLGSLMPDFIGSIIPATIKYKIAMFSKEQ